MSYKKLGILIFGVTAISAFIGALFPLVLAPLFSVSVDFFAQNQIDISPKQTIYGYLVIMGVAGGFISARFSRKENLPKNILFILMICFVGRTVDLVFGDLDTQKLYIAFLLFASIAISFAFGTKMWGRS